MIDRRFFIQSASVAAAKALFPAVATAGASVQARNISQSEDRWWMLEPIRWLQTNLRETNAALKPSEFLKDVAGFHVNVLMMNAGGITAYYPTNIQFAYVSPYMPKGQDTFGEVLEAAHKLGIRVVSRWDFSKTHKDVYDAHPEWFFRAADGQPVVYNGLYQVCINGGWYRQKANEILGEFLDRYDVDGCFFNMFSNPFTDYGGRPIGLCHCDNCQRIFKERFKGSIPEVPDADYRLFLHDAGKSVSISIRDLMRAKRPKAALVGTTPEIGDIVYGEANTAIRRPLPLWPYEAGDNSNRWLNTYSGKGVVCQGMSFVDFGWRFSVVPQPEIRTRIWQNVANGGAAAFNLHGTIAEQQDRTAIDAAIPAYKWLQDHQDYFVGQTSHARVILLAPRPGGVEFQIGMDSYRGWYRLLTEQHIPFAAMENLDWIGKRDADLVICPGKAPAALADYLQNGGRLILSGSAVPEFDIAPAVKLWKSPDGAYFRIRDKALFASMKEVDVVFMYEDYLQVQADNPPVTFITPSLYGPPELVGVGWKETEYPGLVIKQIGKGKVAWLPWNIGGLYYRHSSEAHARLMSDLIDPLLPEGRQLRTNAHPLVAITYMRQRDRSLIHLVNLSGHADTGYFRPLPMKDIQISVKGDYSSGRAIRSSQSISTRKEAGTTQLTLPSLEEYELIELRP